jgi:hypothetical protein
MQIDGGPIDIDNHRPATVASGMALNFTGSEHSSGRVMIKDQQLSSRDLAMFLAHASICK